MCKPSTSCLLFLLLIISSGQIAMAQIYVSPQGDDAHNGTRATPIRTLQRAVQMSRGAKDRRIILELP